MSITFHISNPVEPTSWALRCWNFDRLDDLPNVTGNRAAAEHAADEHAADCLDCLTEGRPIIDEIYDVAPVNLANANAGAVLRMLGYVHTPAGAGAGAGLQTEPMSCGEVPAEQFASKVALALDVESADPGENLGANVYALGQRPGYLADRLTQLHELATYAVAHHHTIVWS